METASLNLGDPEAYTDGVPYDVFARLRPFDEHGEVVGSLPEREHQIAILFEAAAALQDSLRFGLVFPEIGRSGARLEAGQLVFGAGGFKDSSGDRQRAC